MGKRGGYCTCPHLTMREAGIIVRVGGNKVGYWKVNKP